MRHRSAIRFQISLLAESPSLCHFLAIGGVPEELFHMDSSEQPSSNQRCCRQFNPAKLTALLEYENMPRRRGTPVASSSSPRLHPGCPSPIKPIPAEPMV